LDLATAGTGVNGIADIELQLIDLWWEENDVRTIDLASYCKEILRVRIDEMYIHNICNY